MATLTIRIGDKAEEIIQRRMGRSGDTNKSQHVLAGYLNNSGDGEARMASLEASMQELASLTKQTNNLLERLIAMRTDKVELSILAGVFLMLHKSVTPAVAVNVEQYVSALSVEQFLKAGRTA